MAAEYIDGAGRAKKDGRPDEPTCRLPDEGPKLPGPTFPDETCNE
jgi:hypothetical protein